MYGVDICLLLVNLLFIGVNSYIHNPSSHFHGQYNKQFRKCISISYYSKPSFSSVHLRKQPNKRSVWSDYGSLQGSTTDHADNNSNSKNSNNENDSQLSQTTISSTKPSSSSNIDLFAVGPKRLLTDTQTVMKPDVKAPTLTNISLSTGPSVVISSKTSTTSSSTTIPVSRIPQMEMQAEKLRLEAEIEQISIDEARVEQDIKRLIEIDQIISKISVGKMSIKEAIHEHKPLIRKEMYFRIAELANAAIDLSEKQKFIRLADELLEAAKEEDSALHAELMADIQKELNLEINRLKSTSKSRDLETARAYDEVLQRWMSQTKPVNASTTSTGVETPFVSGIPLNSLLNESFIAMGPSGIVRLPSALPITLLPQLLRESEISKADYEILKATVFTPDLFNVSSIELSSFFISVKGKISTSINPPPSYASLLREINRRIVSVPGLEERLRVIILPEYQNPNPNNLLTEKYSGAQFEPVILVLNRAASPKSQGLVENGLMTIAFVATCLTSLVFATEINSLNPTFVQQAVSGDGNIIFKLIPVILGLIGQQLIHEVGHAVAAKTHNVKLQLPIFFPSFQLGLFGAITRYLGFAKTRKAMFDIAISGPLAGYIASLSAMIFGIMQTMSASPDVLSNYPALPVEFFRSSFLLNEILANFLHITQITNSVDPTNTASNVITSAVVSVHPAIAVGAIGLLTNALNFLPIGRLDGGRIATAIAGRQSANVITLVMLLLQGISLLGNVSPAILFWTISVAVLQRGQEIPPENDVTAVASSEDDKRKTIDWYGRLFALLFCALLTGAIMLPAVSPLDLTSALPPSGTSI